MKRLLLTFLIAMSTLTAFAMNAETWGNYLVFDPDQREALLSYPKSWIRPGSMLFDHDYQDSSSTYGKWEQIFTFDESRSKYGMSNNIIAKYTPYSFPQRWSGGLQFINYKGGNSTYRTDAVLHYEHKKGSIEYFHTNNTQRLRLNAMYTDHLITAHGLSFNYRPLEKMTVRGSINYNLIEQQDRASGALIDTRTYDIHHEYLGVSYSFLNSFSAYGNFHYWYYVNEDRQGPAWLFYPGIRYNGKILSSHFSLRVAKTTVHPIFEIALKPGPFYIHAYAKTRSSRLALAQSANQYLGVRSGLKLASDHHYFNANAEYNYDIVRSVSGDSTINNDFYCFKANGEYRLKTRSFDLYAKGNYFHSVNPREGYYNPEKAVLTAGSIFRINIAKGSLKLKGDLNAQYIIHEDPDNVSFDPSLLIYTLNGPSSLVGDWKINFDLTAKIQSFAITANVSTPVKFTSDPNYFFYEGVYTSSDFRFGNVFYAGLTLEWLWWK